MCSDCLKELKAAEGSCLQRVILDPCSQLPPPLSASSTSNSSLPPHRPVTRSLSQVSPARQAPPRNGGLFLTG